MQLYCSSILVSQVISGNISSKPHQRNLNIEASSICSAQYNSVTFIRYPVFRLTIGSSASDPKEKRVGSGGGTAFLLSELFQQQSAMHCSKNGYRQEKRMIIHAGGQSRRSACLCSRLAKAYCPCPCSGGRGGQQLNQTTNPPSEHRYSTKYLTALLKN